MCTMQALLDGQLVGIDQHWKRKSYTQEYKLEVAHFYRVHNLHQAAKKYTFNTNTTGRWVADETKIKQSKKLSKCVKTRSKMQV